MGGWGGGGEEYRIVTVICSWQAFDAVNRFAAVLEKVKSYAYSD